MNMTWARNAFALLYGDICTVYDYQPYRREDGSTGLVRRMVYSDLPCRISFDNIKRVYQTETVGHTMQSVRLFTYPEPVILPGSCVDVVRRGKVYHYKSSGIPAVYETHQELLLEPEKTGA